MAQPCSLSLLSPAPSISVSGVPKLGQERSDSYFGEVRTYHGSLDLFLGDGQPRRPLPVPWTPYFLLGCWRRGGLASTAQTLREHVRTLQQAPINAATSSSIDPGEGASPFTPSAHIPLVPREHLFQAAVSDRLALSESPILSLSGSLPLVPQAGVASVAALPPTFTHGWLPPFLLHTNVFQKALSRKTVEGTRRVAQLAE